LEPSKQKVLSYRPKSALYFWPLGIALMFLSLTYYGVNFGRWYVQRSRVQALKVGGHD